MMSLIIQLKGLPATAASSDIRQFFCGLNIPRGGVSIIGGIYGEAYIVFATHDDARQAMNLSGRLLKDSFVYLEYSNEEEMKQALEIVRIGLKSSLTISNNTKSPEKDNVPAVYLYIRGLPIEATWTDIQEFFRGLCVEGVLFLKVFNGYRSGKAIIKFGNAADASEAMKFNNQPLRYSPVVLTSSSEEEWNQNGGDNIAKRERSPERSSRSRSRSPKIGFTRQGGAYVHEYYVHLLNLSFDVEKSDIKSLFSDMCMKDSHINFLVDKQGRRTREGFVMFRRERDYKRALTFNKETLKGYTLNVLPISRAAMYRLIDHMRVSACNDRPGRRKSPIRSLQEHSNETVKRQSPSRSSQERSNHTDRRKSPSQSSKDRSYHSDRKRSRSRSSQDRKDHSDSKRSRSRSSQDHRNRPHRRRSGSRTSQDRKDRPDRKRSRSQSSQDRKDRPDRKRSRSQSSQDRKDRPDRQRSRSRSSQDRKDRPNRKRSRSRSSLENGHQRKRRSQSRSSQERIYHVDWRRSPERMCLYLRNFPYNVTKSDIQNFFIGQSVKEDDIYLVHNESIGFREVLVTYKNEKEASRAEIQNNQTYQGIKILVIRVTKEQAKEIQAIEHIQKTMVIKAESLSGVTSESLPHVSTSTLEAPVQANAPLEANAPLSLIQATLPIVSVAQVHTIVEPSSLEDLGVGSHSGIVPPSGIDLVADAASDFIQTTPVTQNSLAKQSPHHVNGCDKNSNTGAEQMSSKATQLFMRNLPVSVTATEILDFFRDFKISSVNLQNIDTGEATVCMMSYKAAVSAIETLNNGELALRQVSLGLI